MENSKTLLQRIFDFQQENIEIKQTKKAYGYNYAPLDTIMPIIKPILRHHGIGYVHTTGFDKESNQNNLHTILFNVDDPKDRLASTTNIDGSVKLAKMNTFMVIGSAMTYFRRYHLCVMLGLLTDEDSDAGGGVPSSGKSVENAKQEVDYITIFQNLIDKGKTKEVIEKSLNNYKAQMPEDQFKAINDIISNHFNK